MIKEHQFLLTVKTSGNKSSAASAVLCAFASRNPDGCELFLRRIANNRQARIEKCLRRVLEWCNQESPDFEIDADAIKKALKPL